MNSNVSDFFLELAKNSELLEKFKGKSLDECYEMARKNEKWNFTKEELLAVLKKLIERESRIDDESLSNVSGGIDFFKKFQKEYPFALTKEKSNWSQLFGDFTGLIGDAGYLYNAIVNFKNKMDEDEINYLKKQETLLKQVIEQENKKKKSHTRS